MPELPEVEIVRRGMEPALLHKKIAKITLNRPDIRVPIPSDLPRIAKGRNVESMIRRGKYILITLEGGRTIIMHLGMSGRVSILRPGEKYQAQVHDHVIFDIEDKGKIIFNDPRRFGMVTLSAGADWSKDKPFCDMGPEPLGNDFSGAYLAARLRDSRTPIKSALLDQRVVAGLGNIYVCEALFESGISPLKQAGRIKPEKLGLLTRSIRDVLGRALAAGGSSLKDYRHTDGTLGYFQTGFSVYDREDKPCPGCACKKSIVRIVQAGRSTFYCPVKQK